MSFLRSALFSNSALLDDFKVSFMDIGARGDLPPPWVQLENRFPNRISIAGFETDAEERLKLQEKFPSRNYFPIGLAKEDGVLDFYLNKAKSTSSLFAPNALTYKKFDNKHSMGRVVEQKTHVEVSRLDSLDLSSFRSAFVKLDVQGAELDILIGGEGFFSTNAIGFTAETWTYEVYKNQPLMHDVMKWARDHNYEIYGLEETGRWDFHSSRPRYQRGVPVCVDLLFFRSFDSFMSQSPTLKELASFALILDLWGFSSKALSLLELYSDQLEVHEFAQLIKNCQRRRLFEKHKLNDIVDKIYIRLGLNPSYPPIHD